MDAYIPPSHPAAVMLPLRESWALLDKDKSRTIRRLSSVGLPSSKLQLKIIMVLADINLPLNIMIQKPT
jgi:hypothetical protein